MNKYFIALLFICISFHSYAQNIGINATGASPDGSAILDVDATNKGLLLPRMSTVQRDAIVTPATGLLVYVNDDNTFYYYNGTAWVPLFGDNFGWKTAGNANTNATTNFLGTTDAVDLVIRTNTTEKMRITSAGDVGIGTSSPTSKFDVVFEDDIQFAGTSFRNSDGAITFINWTASPNEFDPAIISYSKGSANPGLNVLGVIETADDVGTEPVVRFQASAFNPVSDIATRPLFSWSNRQTSKMLMDKDGNLGINTLVPSEKLHVAGSIRMVDGNELSNRIMVSDANGVGSWQDASSVNTNSWQLTGNTGTNPATNFLGTTDAIDLVFRTNNIERMRIDTSGLVGIGTDTPEKNLEVVGDGVQTIQLRSTDNSAVQFRLKSNWVNRRVVALDSSDYVHTQIAFRDSGEVNFSGNHIDNDRHMTITKEGNIGIGTANPNVNGTGTGIEISGDGQSGLRITDTEVGGEVVELGVDIVGGFIQTFSPGASLRFYTGQAFPEVMRMLPSGNVGIATLNPSEKLDVNGNINLPTTGVDTSGIIKQNGNRVFHTYGTNSVFLGSSAGNFTFTGGSNVGIGAIALDALTTGGQNTAIGYQSQTNNQTGQNNVSVGYSSLTAMLSGSDNIAIGSATFRNSTSGSDNVVIGTAALEVNLTGNNSVAIGDQASRYNLGTDNVVIGGRAGDGTSGNTDYDNSVLIGRGAGSADLTGDDNVAIGRSAGANMTSGANNVLLGQNAADNLTTGSNNLIIGYDIDAPVASNNNQMSIGNLIFGTGVDGTGTTVSSGNVGIGTATPVEKLDVNGNINIPTTSDTTGIIKSNGFRFIHRYGISNTFVGRDAGNFTLTGQTNTALGKSALQALTSGNQNTAIGAFVLDAVQDGTNNVGLGYDALSAVTSGNNNIGIGVATMRNATTSSNSIAIGGSALEFSVDDDNIAIGDENSRYNIGRRNVTMGSLTGAGTLGNTDYDNSVIIGYAAATDDLTGDNNTIIGYVAGSSLTSGAGNIFLGQNAGDNVTTGSNNLILGTNIDAPSPTTSNQMSIGNLIFSEGIDGTGTTVSSGNIGIATATPAEKLDVNGNVRVQDSLQIGDGIKIAQHIGNTVTWDPANLASDGDATTQNITVTGAAVGDLVNVGHTSIAAAGAILTGIVTAPNQVTVTLFNKTGGTYDAASGTLRVGVWKY